jgi:hypothetical protein
MSTSTPDSSVKQSLSDLLHTEILPALQRAVDSLPDSLSAAAEAERLLRDAALATARSLLVAWGKAADTATDRPACPCCADPMRHKGHRNTTCMTTVGSVRFRRPRYRCDDCSRDSYPHDRILRFLGHGVSWPLAKVISRNAAQVPFEQARDNVEADYGVHLSKQTIERVAQAAGSEILKHEDEQRQRVAGRQEPLPDSDLQPQQVCLFADGTTIHTEGDWHEVRVATATAHDRAGLLLARQSRARFLAVADFAWMLALLARCVGYQNAQQKAFIADGAHWLWKLAEDYFPSATQILDWYHLAEHVHKAAKAVFGETSAGAEQWARQRKTELWEGQLEKTLQAIESELSRVRAESKRGALRELRTYLENNRGRVDYPRYREAGLPIGSGQVEAQCKCLVGARCKQAGMRDWSYRGAEAVLRLRAALQDGSYDRVWEARLAVAA